jgi:2'-5' RNA ligase
MRLFVSVDLDGLAPQIRSVQELFADADGLRLTDETQAHLTLKFLGDVNPKRLPALSNALREAVDVSGVEPFQTVFGGLGVFPDLEYIRVVWLGVREGGEQFGTLHEQIEERTVASGFEPAEHEFTPHVTLARADHADGEALVQTVVSDCDPDAGSMHVSEVRLTESTLTDSGRTYSTVERFAL